MNEQWAELLGQLPQFLGGHVQLSLAALAVGLLLSVPLGIAVSRRPRWAELTLTLAGIIQTVPSLALLAVMVLALGFIGFEPAFIALTLYSILPILANTIIGIRGIDPVLIEAGRGLGMNDWQLLMRVQLPLASPVIIGGIRTATVGPLAVTMSGTAGFLGRTSVKGPGQKRSARRCASSGQLAVTSRASSMVATWTMRGLVAGRPLALKIRDTAAASRALAASP